MRHSASTASISAGSKYMSSITTRLSSSTCRMMFSACTRAFQLVYASFPRDAATFAWVWQLCSDGCTQFAGSVAK